MICRFVQCLHLNQKLTAASNLCHFLLIGALGIVSFDAGDASPDKTLVDSKVEEEQAEADPNDRSCQNEPQSPKKQSPKE